MNSVESRSPAPVGGTGSRRGAAAAVMLGAAVTILCGCASGGSGNARYPRRAPGCALSVYHTAVPEVAAWDDLGVAEAVCNIGLPVAECLRMLRAEACRMGGDILYNVPHKPFRPRDQVMQFRGQVAHTRLSGSKHADDAHDSDDREKANDGPLPPPASPEESVGPVVPLPSAHPPGGTEPPPPEKAPPP